MFVLNVNYMILLDNYKKFQQRLYSIKCIFLILEYPYVFSFINNKGKTRDSSIFVKRGGWTLINSKNTFDALPLCGHSGPRI